MARISMRNIILCHVMTLMLVVLARADNDQYRKYKDPTQPMNLRIRNLMKQMTLAEKIGQMVQIERTVASPDLIRNYSIGSVMSDSGSVPSSTATPQEWIKMINGFQTGAISSRLGIPLMYGVNAVHGHNSAYKATVFPHNVGLGATRDPGLVRRIGAATALEVRATGINYVFAPCVAVCRDPRWGRCYESYSEDPTIVKQMTEIIPGLQGDIPPHWKSGSPFVSGRDKVAACAKHYVGDGGTENGANRGDTVGSFHNLLSVHMPAFLPSIIKGVSTIMTSYSTWNGEQIHNHKFLVTEFLKNTLRFRGFVISDWKGVERTENYTDSVHAAISAGIDMVMDPDNHNQFIKVLTNLVNQKTIPMARIDDAVARILRVKFAMGLFENPWADETHIDHLGSQAHRDLAREAVRKSLVLLKNGDNKTGPMLPLPKHSHRILVAGTHANNLGFQCGGWTISHQGLNGNNYTTGTTILSGITSTVDPTTEIFYHTNPPADFIEANNFSYSIVVVGEIPYAESQGDNGNLTIPEAGLNAINNVCEWTKCVVVLVSGRPLVIQPYLSKITALVAAWLPGTEGQGIADVLYGDYGFTGKLPRTWFKSVSQLPMNVGDKNYDPLFPFGFGIGTKPVGSDDDDS
ncbi:Beta-glucosidase BoGH3B [Linum grandiflorum]